MALVVLNRVCLEQLTVHAVKLDQKVLVEGEVDLAKTHLVDHHEGDFVFLRGWPLVDHVHVDDVVLHENVVSLLPLAWFLLIDLPDSTCNLVTHNFLLVLLAKLQHDTKDAFTDIEVAQYANHILELWLLTHFSAVLDRGKSLKLLEKCSNHLKLQAEARSDPLNSFYNPGRPVRRSSFETSMLFAATTSHFILVIFVYDSWQILTV